MRRGNKEIIADIKTSHDAVKWAINQGPHNSTPEQAVLMFLSCWTFVTSDNDENAPRGMALYYKSRIGEIMKGTGIRSRTTVRNALNSLQAKGFIRRKSRGGAVWDHTEIYLLWEPADEDLRADVRAGEIEAPSHWGAFVEPQEPVRRGHLSLVVGGRS